MGRSVSRSGGETALPGGLRMMPVRDRRNMVIVGAVALAMRVILLIGYSPVLTRDSASYLNLAHRLAALNLTGSSGARTPGYPLILLVLGYSPRAVWCLQALLGVVATVMVYRLVRRVGGTELAALLGALFYALDLEVLAIEHMVMTETVASFLILLGASLAVEIVESDQTRLKLATLTGVTLAYLCLIRPDMVAITVYLGVAVVIARHTPANRTQSLRRTVLRCGVPLVIPPLILLAAWAGVNRATIGVTSVSTVIGYNMIDHVAPYVRAQPGPDFAITSAYVAARDRRQERDQSLANVSTDAEPQMERAAHLTAAHLSGRLLGIAIGVIEQHPLAYVASSLRQWPRFWLPPNYADQFRGGFGSRVIHVIWPVERALKLLLAAAFLLLSLREIIRRLRGRSVILTRSSAVLAGIVVVGIIPPTFLAFGDTGRYGYIYYPLVLTVAVVLAEPLLRGAHLNLGWLRGRANQTSA